MPEYLPADSPLRMARRPRELRSGRSRSPAQSGGRAAPPRSPGGSGSRENRRSRRTGRTCQTAEAPDPLTSQVSWHHAGVDDIIDELELAACALDAAISTSCAQRWTSGRVTIYCGLGSDRASAARWRPGAAGDTAPPATRRAPHDGLVGGATGLMGDQAAGGPSECSTPVRSSPSGSSGSAASSTTSSTSTRASPARSSSDLDWTEAMPVLNFLVTSASTSR